MASTSGTVESERYILSDIDANNNKYWHITRFSDNTVETHWGRVGEYGQKKPFPHGSEDAAIRFFKKKCSEKERKGYQKQQTLESKVSPVSVEKENLKELATKQIETSCPETSALVEYLTERNVHNILSATTMSYDTSKGTFSTPLGIVTGGAINTARGLLTEIGELVVKDKYDDPDMSKILNQYLMLIPQDIGRSKPDPRRLYPDVGAIQRQSALLDALEASLQSVLSTPSSSPIEHPRLFEVKLSLVEDGKEIDRVIRKYEETRKGIHESSQLEVHKVYLVEIAAMRRAFEEDGAKMDNIWELWHGTRVGNLLSILKVGFQVPPRNASYCTGRMFGNGMYHSDQSTKSLNYAYGYWDGGARDTQCFMFLNNVAMGNYYTPTSYSENLPKAGYDSTYAIGGKSGVANNEMIVYRTSQVDPVLLVQFGKKGK